MNQLVSPDDKKSKSIMKDGKRPTSYNMKYQKKQTYFAQCQPNPITKSIQRVSKQINTFKDKKKIVSQSRKPSNNSSIQDTSWRQSISKTEVIHSNNSSFLPSEQNKKLNDLHKRLYQIEKSPHFSQRAPTGNMSSSLHKKQKFLPSQAFIKNHKISNTVRSRSREDGPLSEDSLFEKHYLKTSMHTNKNQLSIMAISDNNMPQNSKLYEFFDISCKKSQIFQGRESRQHSHTRSIHYYTLNKDLSDKKKLKLKPIQKHQPHRGRITEILVTPNSDVFTSSLDYSVCLQEYDSPMFYKYRQHRGGVQCLYWWNHVLLSGGRDGFIRSFNDQYYKIGRNINKIQGAKRSLLVQCTNDLLEIDFESRKKILKTVKFNKKFSLFQYYDKVLIGTQHQLKIYDDRIRDPVTLFQTPEPISYWQSVNDKIVGVGHKLWICDLLGDFKSKDLPGQEPVISVCQYFSSYLISRKNAQVLLYDTQLNLVVNIQVESNVMFKYSRNRIVCGYDDGRLQYCQIKEQKQQKDN